MPAIHFVDQGLSLEVEPGRTILEAARAAQAVLESPCNAVGTCGKCRVRLSHNEQRRNLAEGESGYRLSEEEKQQGYVLACHARIYGDIEVYTGSKTTENDSLRILSRGNSFEYPLRPFIEKKFDGRATGVFGGGKLLGEEPGDTAAEMYGIAMDIGTTTLVMEVIDLHSGAVLAGDSMLNPQSAYAQDVLTRIHFAGSHEDGLEILRQAFIGAFKTMLGHVTGTARIDPRQIYEAVFSGNTTMLHMAIGADPSSLGKYPYTMEIQGGVHVPARDLHLSPFALVYLPPLISAFVGADITAGILASQLDRKKGITLFIDVGTNGEMVLAKDGVLAATSTAAGPAFEGMNIDCGMRAANGAVEEFSIDNTGKADFKVIGGGEAFGICGSGLLDITGELVRTGVVGKTGRFVSPEAIPESLRANFGEREGKPAFFITRGVYINQKDIRQVQLAKGAIRSGLISLLNRMGVGEEAVDRVEIAGSFGYHLRESSLLNIGLLPPSFKGKVYFSGNTSQSGAAAFLLNATFRDRMKDLAAGVEKVELANTAEFERLFVNSLGF
ncbi:MAG: ASKHA domain-containing protein [Treponema sp.]|jgi:uncharacterized 2Fe-2S/4Fe-4S cluster protein (DUF4445 family)|nr:ASKHA domain-containing protein [Treponema sp.]